MIPNDVQDSHAAFAALHAMWQTLARPIKVLVVEDDRNDVDLLRYSITGYRVAIEIAVTAAEAKQWLEQRDYDLCVLDLKLPDASGTEVLKWAKEKDLTVPFAVLTGAFDDDPRIQEAFDAGAKGVFRKPLSQENVRMILGAVK